LISPRALYEAENGKAGNHEQDGGKGDEQSKAVYLASSAGRDGRDWQRKIGELTSTHLPQTRSLLGRWGVSMGSRAFAPVYQNLVR
jgi:hypothetical protein